MGHTVDRRIIDDIQTAENLLLSFWKLTEQYYGLFSFVFARLVFWTPSGENLHVSQLYESD